MTDDIKRFEFLLGQKPICTQSPIKSFLGPDKHRELRAKYKIELGLDLLDDRCDNVFNCKSANQGCIGRPFPIDPNIYQALMSINVDISVETHRGVEVYLARAVVECYKCPFREGCEEVCASQDSYLRRNTHPDSNPPDNRLVPYDAFENGKYKALPPEVLEHCEYGDWVNESLPLDCLSHNQRQVIEMTVYQSLEQPIIADIMRISIPRVSQLKAKALSRLTEFGRARKVIVESGSISSRVLDYYLNNLTHQEIADKEGVSRSAVTMSINKWKSKYL